MYCSDVSGIQVIMVISDAISASDIGFDSNANVNVKCITIRVECEDKRAIMWDRSLISL